MTKIVDIDDHLKKRRGLKIVKTDDKERDDFMNAMGAAMHSAKASRNWPQAKKAHLLNCRDALDRALFYLEDELLNDTQDVD